LGLLVVADELVLANTDVQSAVTPSVVRHK